MPINRILLDHNVSSRLIRHLRPHEAVHASHIGLAAVSNGDLIRAANQAGFTLMLTCDQNIQYQQNLAGRPLAFVVLSTTRLDSILDHLDQVLAAIDAAVPGSFTAVTLPRPPRRRRPFSPSSDP